MIGLGLYHQLSLGAGGLPPAALAYFIRTLFSGVAGQPVNLTDLQVLDTAEEGLVDGSMTVYEDAAGTGNSVAITGDACVLTGGTTPTTPQAGLTTAISVAVADGQVFYARATPLDNTSNVVPLILLNSNTHNYGSGGGFRVGGFLFEATGNVWVYFGATSTEYVSVGTYTAVEHEFCAVLASGQVFYYIKGGIWTAWTLVYVDASQAVDPVYATFNGYSGALTLSEFKAPETLYPELVTPAFGDDFATDLSAWDSVDGKLTVSGGSLVPDAPTQRTNNVIKDNALTEKKYIKWVVADGIIVTSYNTLQLRSSGAGYIILYRGDSGTNTFRLIDSNALLDSDNSIAMGAGTEREIHVTDDGSVVTARLGSVTLTITSTVPIDNQVQTGVFTTTGFTYGTLAIKDIQVYPLEGTIDV